MSIKMELPKTSCKKAISGEPADQPYAKEDLILEGASLLLPYDQHIKTPRSD
ncbi:13651_t:CDS:2 [Dentiscutata erythropus]|uniref:13651_t:CDS:1 n=1 Tax=Dentiscutata erythropus TaxID=1348616 RepID=A0A9N9HWK8_9GLOM|nr:13651_t:CDS:2 [Dentiscutata erythropus]